MNTTEHGQTRVNFLKLGGTWDMVIRDGRKVGTGTIIISAHKLSKTMARAVAVRALLEGLNQTQTQALFDSYARSRKLM